MLKEERTTTTKFALDMYKTQCTKISSTGHQIPDQTPEQSQKFISHLVQQKDRPNQQFQHLQE